MPSEPFGAIRSPWTKPWCDAKFAIFSKHWEEMMFSFGCILISPKLFMRLFCKSQFPHKSVNLSLIVTNVKNKLTDSCGN